MSPRAAPTPAASQPVTATPLPSGWANAPIGTLVQLFNGYPFKPAQWEESGLPIIRIQNLNNPVAAYNHHSGVLPDRFIVNQGDLLFAWSGTPGTSFGAHVWMGDRAYLNQHIFRVVFDEQLFDKRLLKHAINQNLNHYIRESHGGAGLAHITKGKFEATEVLVPPRREQDRIADRIDELFSDLSAGIAALERVRRKLDRYRAAVLHAAVTGRLTSAWRAQHGKAAEPASALLARILKARRVRWETDQLAKLVSAGKALPKGWRERYTEPAGPGPTGLPAIPKTWCWATLGQLAALGSGTTPSRSEPRFWRSGSVPWITSSAVNLPFVDEPSELVTPAALEETTLRLYPVGTLLMALYGEGKTRAKVTELRLQATINQAMAALVFDDPADSCRAFVKAALWAQYDKLRRQAAGGVQDNLNVGIVGQVAVPLPPLAEQTQIVGEVGRQLSLMSELENEVERALKRTTRLRQAILKAAFDGRLVPQDPTDEPASVLLGRLAAPDHRASESGVAAGAQRTATQRIPSRGRRL